MLETYFKYFLIIVIIYLLYIYNDEWSNIDYRGRNSVACLDSTTRDSVSFQGSPHNYQYKEYFKNDFLDFPLATSLPNKEYFEKKLNFTEAEIKEINKRIKSMNKPPVKKIVLKKGQKYTLIETLANKYGMGFILYTPPFRNNNGATLTYTEKDIFIYDIWDNKYEEHIGKDKNSLNSVLTGDLSKPIVVKIDLVDRNYCKLYTIISDIRYELSIEDPKSIITNSTREAIINPDQTEINVIWVNDGTGVKIYFHQLLGKYENNQLYTLYTKYMGTKWNLQWEWTVDKDYGLANLKWDQGTDASGTTNWGDPFFLKLANNPYKPDNYKWTGIQNPIPPRDSQVSENVIKKEVTYASWKPVDSKTKALYPDKPPPEDPPIIKQLVNKTMGNIGEKFSNISDLSRRRKLRIKKKKKFKK